jgi:hypothetical protein
VLSDSLEHRGVEIDFNLKIKLEDMIIHPLHGDTI